MVIWRRDNKQQRRRLVGVGRGVSGVFPTSRRKVFRWLLMGLAFFAVLPPLFFHFKLRRFQQMQLRKCSWLKSPPLVCAHGGDSSKAFPNTFSSFTRWMHTALHFVLKLIVLKLMFLVLLMGDFLLFMTDRDLQRILGNSTSRVGHWSTKEIEELDTNHHLTSKFGDLSIPTIDDALKVVAGSVRQVILDAKVGPPSFEKGLAKDIISAVERTKCSNCLVWAKSDSLVRDILKQSADIVVGYIVMMDPATGTRTNLLRMRGAGVVGVYHPLVDEKLVKVIHRRKKKVYAWTVDDEISMQKMLLEQVDAVVSSNPTLFQRVLQDMRRECLEQGFSMSS